MRLATISATGVLSCFVSGLVNPIIPGFNPDPSIIRVGGDFFLATSTFEFFPGVPIYHSTDLVRWENIGHALSRPSQLNLRGTAPSGGIFAPTLRFHDGVFYLVDTAFDVINPPDNVTRIPRSFYVTTTDIFNEDSWSEPTYVDQWGFDGDLFFDDDGKVYFTSTFSEFVDNGNFANWITEIDIKTGDSLTNSRLLHTTTVPPELGYPLTEGSHIYKWNGTYYMLTADSGTEANQKANIYRSTNLEGPWEHNPHNPVLWNGEDMSLPVLATGHADIVDDLEGNWWAVFLATRPQNPRNSSGLPQLGRETFLCPVTWDEDGWPIFNNNEPITEYMPDVLYDLDRPKVWRDDFDGGLVDKSYYYLRTPYKDFKDFESNPGKLRIKGNVYTLSHRETPAALLRKQVDINTTFSTELSSSSPETWRQEAGASIYLSIHYHDEIAVTYSNDTGERAIVVHTRTGPEATLNTTYVEDEDVANGLPVKLFIEAKDTGYRLGYSTGCAPRWLASVENKWLQSYLDGWQNFVGSHFAIYSTGTKLPILNDAEFEYIQTELN
ncbi:Non-reducing end alpha-L-arabinofuranosidase BoGH43A [Colletotrichum orbiculare MAFF 240422]|uniref:Non-reducing end alpha-L-arabinofuranosidase BoGH43A n=1 Tax=Colletotrichum orbiculare (strain 104-T / ATCC 96160 / CBS 514.97 / LARS 414 / MAFF 240422) TaxID=1213857 RepID=N4VBQ3_COLOR|nr:Non-reducing end alpha-L-arabinofuranosidase BoGH43A [Colletotrichum orbiculare MAFF 240422]